MTDLRTGLSRGLLVLGCTALWIVAALTAGASEVALRDAVESALSTHSSLTQAEHDLRKAELELAAVRAQVLLPSMRVDLRPFNLAQGESFPGVTQGTVALSLGLTTGTAISLDLSPGYRWDAEQFSFTWRLSISQRHDPTRPTPAEARALADAVAKVASAHLALAQTRETVLLSVVQIYANLLASGAAVADAERSITRARDSLAVVQSAVASGQAGQLQLLEAEIAVRDAEIALRKRAAAHASALEELVWDVGLDGSAGLRTTGNLAPVLMHHAEELLSGDIPAEALAATGTVKTATDAVRAAEDKVRALQLSGWPVPAVSLTLTETGWRVGFSLSLLLYAPDRAAQRQIAQAELALAQDRLAAAWREAERSVSQMRSALQEAREAVVIMDLEREKLALERTAVELRREGGLVGPAEWEAFLLREQRSVADHEQRLLGLLQAYWRYRRALGLELDWEEVIR